uniref:V-type proton ATPase subunit C n=1 Tax=Neogobius melanostomus TaxID=47308 RepID=A0A8C6V7I5_9GOBI
MSDLWLISVPLDKTSSTNVEKLKRTIAKSNQASCCKFFIPELKVEPTMYQLFCTQMTFVIKKTCQCMKEVMEQSSDKVLENAFANGVDLTTYVTRFQWDKAKYSTSLSLSALTEIISKEVTLVETELKSRSAAYNSLKSSLQNVESKHRGTLHSRCLNDIVRKEDLVVSEYLTTLLVIVNSYNKWERTYESLSDFVVPRSSRRLYEDEEAGVFSVTLFKRAVNRFKAKAQESKFTVREYCVELEEQKRRDLKQLTVCKKEQYGVFVRWLKVNFNQLFIAWIHVKALRVFAESVLSKLPSSSAANGKETLKKMREELASLFMHLDPTVNCDIPGLCQQEYFSYISFHINTSVLELS